MKLSQIVEAKKRFPRPMKSKGGSILWVCCSEPFRDKTESGDAVWVSACVWKKGGKFGATRRIVGRPAKDPDNPDAPPQLGPKPTEIKLNGKNVRRC